MSANQAFWAAVVISALALSIACFYLQRAKFGFVISIGLTFMAASVVPMLLLTAGTLFESPTPSWLNAATDYSMGVFWGGFLMSVPVLPLTAVLHSSLPNQK